eukprot:scaffold2529_cov122-Isochrysis_galbana.AAC.12
MSETFSRTMRSAIRASDSTASASCALARPPNGSARAAAASRAEKRAASRTFSCSIRSAVSRWIRVESSIAARAPW